MEQDWRNWLTARPIAHRGLFDVRHGVVENSLAAADRAIARNFAIECDVQLSADGQAIVFHDFELEQLTTSSGPLLDVPARTICAAQFRDGPGQPSMLADFIHHIGGKVALVIEIKSSFDGDMRLADRVAQIASSASARLAIKSFDPAIMTHLRRNSVALGFEHIPLGMVAEAQYTHGEWATLNAKTREALTHFLHWEDTKPDFLSWHIGDFPHPTPYLLRSALGVPVMTWTVRTAEQRDSAKLWADQIVFEETKGLRVE